MAIKIYLLYLYINKIKCIDLNKLIKIKYVYFGALKKLNVFILTYVFIFVGRKREASIIQK